MKAFFKEDDELILNYADSNEKLLVSQFYDRATSGKYDIVYAKTLDINGDINGIAIELVDTKDKPDEIEETEEVSEEIIEE